METALLVIGNLIVLLIFIGIPLVLVIKNPQTTLSLIKAGFKLLVSAGKFIAPFIMPFLAWIYARWAIHDEPYWPSSSDDGFPSYEKKPVVTHDKTRWDYDPWLEKR